jgi:competence ComEA-like helix-hairpin-helix protein
MDLMVVKNYGDHIQAHYLALAGIEKATALLYQNARERSRTATSHSGELYNSPDQFRDVAFARGQFRVLRRGREDEGGGIIYGVTDEESRLNANYATADAFTKLYGMTPDAAAAILDWRGDNAASAAASAEYYASLRPPYQPRNGAMQTVRELLMVRGVAPELLLGNDRHQNGMLETASKAEESDAIGAAVDSGWAGLMTVDSQVSNLSAAGEDRVDAQSADEAALTSVKGITSEIAKAIVAYRDQNRFQSVADLLDVTAAPSQNQPNQPNSQPAAQGNQPRQGQQPTSGGNNSQPNASSPNSSGRKVISPDLLMDIADELSVGNSANLPGKININTASLDVLACLPGVDRDLAQAIISFRQSNGFLPNIAWLLKVPGMPPQVLKQVAPQVVTRSETFRILSEGEVTSTGARQRIQAIVRVTLDGVATVSWREEDL